MVVGLIRPDQHLRTLDQAVETKPDFPCIKEDKLDVTARRLILRRFLLNSKLATDLKSFRCRGALAWLTERYLINN